MPVSRLGSIIKQQRIALSLTLLQLSNASGVSSSHLARIERGERFPSARILRRIAQPLDFGEDELFTFAGYLSEQDSRVAEPGTAYGEGKLDPFVARALAQEPVDTQRAVLGILNILKSLAKSSEKNEGKGPSR